jgi:hypothetical protein
MRLPGTGWCSRHFRHLATLAAVPFIFRVAIELFLVGSVVLLPLVFLFSSDTDADDDASSLALLVLWAPLFETLLFQIFLVRIAQFLTQSSRLLILVAWLPFAAAHFMNGVASGIAAGLIGGYFIAFSYVVWVRRSHLKAIAVTVAVHALSNVAVVVLGLFLTVFSALI